MRAPCTFVETGWLEEPLTKRSIGFHELPEDAFQGIFDLRGGLVEHGDLLNMCDAMLHRGPDEEHGPACVGYLRGMFAFALWDQPRRQLMVARDRLGVKPLYWTETQGRLLFASELKAILQMPEVERRLNWAAFDHLLTFLTTSSAESIIESVHKLEPGHVLLASAERGVHVSRYWAVPFEPEHAKPESYFVDGVRGLVEAYIAKTDAS